MTKQQSAEYEITTLNGIIEDLNRKLHVLIYDTEDRAQVMLASLRQDAVNEARGQEAAVLTDLSSLYVPPPCRIFRFDLIQPWPSRLCVTCVIL